MVFNTHGKLIPLSEKRYQFPARIKYKMTEKRQTSQGYIIRILQHFATLTNSNEYY
jgi:hypothetical protein